jgi:uncharacterized protein YjlB
VGSLNLRVIGKEELQATKADIAGTALPETDPILGNSGPIMTIWRNH